MGILFSGNREKKIERIQTTETKQRKAEKSKKKEFNVSSQLLGKNFDRAEPLPLITATLRFSTVGEPTK